MLWRACVGGGGLLWRPSWFETAALLQAPTLRFVVRSSATRAVSVARRRRRTRASVVSVRVVVEVTPACVVFTFKGFKTTGETTIWKWEQREESRSHPGHMFPLDVRVSRSTLEHVRVLTHTHTHTRHIFSGAAAANVADVSTDVTLRPDAAVTHPSPSYVTHPAPSHVTHPAPSHVTHHVTHPESETSLKLPAVSSRSPTGSSVMRLFVACACFLCVCVCVCVCLCVCVYVRAQRDSHCSGF